MNHKYIDNNSEKLIIIFSSIPKQEKTMSNDEYNIKMRTTLTFYNLMKRNDYFSANVLWIPDDFSEGGGWYVSDFGISIFQYLKNFIENFIERGEFNPKNVYTLGFSKGGFASLLYGNVCNNIDNILSFVPQSNIKKHGWLKYLKDHNVNELSLSFTDIEKMKTKNKNKKLFLTKPYYNENEYDIFNNDENVFIVEGKHEYYLELIENILKIYFEKINKIENKILIKNYSELFELNQKKYSIEKKTISNFVKLEKQDGIILKKGDYTIDIDLDETDELLMLRYNLNRERIGQYRFGKNNKFNVEKDEYIWPTIKRTGELRKYIIQKFNLYKLDKLNFSYAHKVDKLLLNKKQSIEFDKNKIIFNRLEKIEELTKISFENTNNKFFNYLYNNKVSEDDIGRTELLKFRSLSWCENIDDICLGIHFLKMYKKEILDEFCFSKGRANILLDYIDRLKIIDNMYYIAALVIINNDINKMLTRKKTYYNHDIMMYKTFFSLLDHKNIGYLKGINKKEIKKYLLESYKEFSDIILNEYGLLVENTPSYNIMVPDWMRKIKVNEKLNTNLKTRCFFNVKEKDYFFNFGDEDFQDNTYFGKNLKEYKPLKRIETIGQFLKYENNNLQLIAKAYTLSCAHQHQDDLSFQLAWNGKLIFIDPGKFKYEYQDERRKYIVSRLAHNTISINNICCSETDDYKKNYLNNRYKKMYFNKYLKPNYTDKNFTLFDDKYGHKIERNFSEFSDDYFEITDSINQSINQSIRTIEYRFNILPIFKIKENKGEIQLLGTNITIELMYNKDLEFRIEEIKIYKKNAELIMGSQLIFTDTSKFIGNKKQVN